MQRKTELDNIVQYIAVHNPTAAEKLGLELIDVAMSLETFPYRGSRVRKHLRVRKLVHVNLLGAMLSAGMALSWLRSALEREKSSFAELVQLATQVPPGSEGLVFLPYLVGERSPLMDPKAKGGFMGLTLRHTTGHLVRALLEGVAFGLRQILDVMVDCGVAHTQLVASGNGLSNPFWRQILADVLDRPLVQGTDEHASERAGVGAALIAGIFKNYEDTLKLAPRFTAVTEPSPDASGLYQSHYSRFIDAYPRLKSWF